MIVIVIRGCLLKDIRDPCRHFQSIAHGILAHERGRPCIAFHRLLGQCVLQPLFRISCAAVDRRFVEFVLPSSGEIRSDDDFLNNLLSAGDLYDRLVGSCVVLVVLVLPDDISFDDQVLFVVLRIYRNTRPHHPAGQCKRSLPLR